MESIDDLLAEVKAEYQEQEQGKQPKKQSFLEVEEFKSPRAVSSTPQSQPLQQHWISPAEERLLSQVKAEFEAEEIAEGLRQQQQLKEEQQRKEQQLREEQLRAQQKEQRKREALTLEAREWLEKLNPRSEEGLWFEEFSYSYPSKLEAAIDYLQALRETHR